jgi:hypothetical protein
MGFIRFSDVTEAVPMRLQGVVTVAVAVHLILASLAAADLRDDILSAVTTFADALEAGDGPKLTQSIWVYENSVADAAGRDSFVKLALAQKQLERAAVARFGAAGGRFRCGFSGFLSSGDRAALAEADITQDPEGVMRVQKAGETYQMRLRRQRNGRWQVVLDILDGGLEDDITSVPMRIEAISRMKLDRYEACARGVAEVAARVESGEYASASAAEADLVARFEQAWNDYLAKRSANSPGRRSFRFDR